MLTASLMVMNKHEPETEDMTSNLSVASAPGHVWVEGLGHPALSSYWSTKLLIHGPMGFRDVAPAAVAACAASSGWAATGVAATFGASGFIHIMCVYIYIYT